MKICKERKPIRFLITKDEEGWHAQAEGISIFTEGDTLEELKENIKKAVRVHLADGEYKKHGLSSPTPKIFSRLQLRRIPRIAVLLASMPS